MKEAGFCSFLALTVAFDAKGWPVALLAEAEAVPSQLQVADGQLPARQFLSHHPSLTFETMLTQGFASSVSIVSGAGAWLRLDCW